MHRTRRHRLGAVHHELAGYRAAFQRAGFTAIELSEHAGDDALVALNHHRTGRPHGVIHGELRRICGGPPTALASVEQLEARIAHLRSH